MVKLWRQILLMSLGCLVVLGVAIEAQSDILFKSSQPIKIGHGRREGAKIHWTDCSGQNPAEFDSPPYSIDLAENCSVGPPAFGLECEGESCRVVDDSKIQKYLPGAHQGEKVRLHIDEHFVDLSSDGSAVHLQR